MIASGPGVAVLPRSAAKLYTRALNLVMLRLRGLEVERMLPALRQRSGLSAAARAVVAMVETEVALDRESPR